MIGHRCARLLLAACVLDVCWQTAGRADPVILDGVQPAALDQPQINVIVYLQGHTDPQVGETEDPLGGLFGDLFGDSGDTVHFFNVQAYLDTGASSILLSQPTATALGLTTESRGSLPVLYSDVGVVGGADFNVSTPVSISLANWIPGQDLDQFSDANQMVPIVTPYSAAPVPANGFTRIQIGPFTPGVTNPGSDDIDQLIQELSAEESAVDVVGMPAMLGKVMVLDTSGVKDLGQLFSVVGGSISGDDPGDISDADLDAISTAGIHTFLYDRKTAPAFDATRTNDPGIPTAQRHVALTFVSFDAYTSVRLEGGSSDPTLPAPTLAHNPFIGKDPVLLKKGLPAGNAPGITITRNTTVGVKSSEGNWLLDTGAAASIISEAQAAAMHVRYLSEPGAGVTSVTLIDSDTLQPIPEQFTLAIGGIGGQETLAGFFLDMLVLPTKEATESGNPDLNIYYKHAPVLVGNISLPDPAFPDDPAKTLTLDGIFGMNMLIESLDIQTDAEGNITDLGDVSPSYYSWITFDEEAGELGLVFDPDAVPSAAVPEPASLCLFAGGMLALMMRRPRQSR
ncbi:MAG TPA: PEP-CTERM sorting domain-containing protein [Phycisphaerae bacterium]|jgi:hypothetical protein